MQSSPKKQKRITTHPQHPLAASPTQSDSVPMHIILPCNIHAKHTIHGSGDCVGEKLKHQIFSSIYRFKPIGALPRYVVDARHFRSLMFCTHEHPLAADTKLNYDLLYHFKRPRGWKVTICSSSPVRKQKVTEVYGRPTTHRSDVMNTVPTEEIQYVQVLLYASAMQSFFGKNSYCFPL